MQDIDKKLQHTLGLTDTEALLYVACLPHESVGVADAVKLTGIKRTTIYHALDTLVYKGFATKKGAAGKVVFSMVAPRSLQHALIAQKFKIEKQQTDLQKLIPSLEILKKGPLSATQVEHFQGLNGVKAVYEEALYCKSRHWDTITPTHIFLRQFGEDFRKYVMNTREKRKISARSLWEQSRLARYTAEKKPINSHNREMRIMPPEMQNRFLSKIILFDKKIALITPASDAGAVLISSPELHAAFMAMFETIWTMSKPIKV